MRKRKATETQTYGAAPAQESGLGPNSAGQSGDTQGLSESPTANSESVEELVEEGQSFEATLTEAVENAPDADASEIHTKEVPEDDVPVEYQTPDR
jgi:hypothetical protein